MVKKEILLSMQKNTFDTENIEKHWKVANKIHKY